MIKDRYSGFEQDYLANTQNAIKANINEELASLQAKRELILEERKYLGEYNYELKEDEIQNLLKVEHVDTNAYVYSLNKITKLGKLSNDPYFARFDFVELDEDEDEDELPEAEDADNYYLGITTLRDPLSGRILIFDWRTPIASLYYESNPGAASYTAPSGEIRGTLFGKRRYTFSKGKLIKYCDVDMPSDDEFLNSALAAHADSHMKTIINTIQTQQYKIMRDYIDGVSILSGCAGSGKSSIALHKIAYIMYHFRNKMEDKKIMIVSPNGVFSDYIAMVLPDLGEENVENILPEEIVNEILKRYPDYNYLSREQAIELSQKAIEYKSTMAFRNTVSDYIKYLSKNIFTPEELQIEVADKEIVIEEATLRDLFYATFSDVPLMDRTMKIAEHICEKHRIRSGDIGQQIYYELQFMMKSLSIPALYKMMYTDSAFISEYGYSLSDDMITKYDSWEDACALALMTLNLCNTDELSKDVFYIIADEAQDLIPVFIDVLKTLYHGSNYLFVGDRNQLVFTGTGDFAEDIKTIVLKRPLRVYSLDTNYRSTIEISDYSMKYLSTKANIKSVRHGQSVIEHNDIHGEKLRNSVISTIEEMINDGYTSVTILCNTLNEARDLERKLMIPLSVSGKISIKAFPVYLAKGLEYDCIITVNVEDKLMYTACTRAMHKLAVYKNCSL